MPNLSETTEAFQDTPVVNGTAYPYMNVQPQAYRFRILNAADDRSFNLQMYVASSIVSSISVTSGGSGYTTAPVVTITPNPSDTGRRGPGHGIHRHGHRRIVTAITLVSVGSEYTLPPIVTLSAPPAGGTQATATAAIYTGNTEVGMVPAVPGAAAFPDAWTVQTIGKPGDILDNRPVAFRIRGISARRWCRSAPRAASCRHRWSGPTSRSGSSKTPRTSSSATSRSTISGWDRPSGRT